MSKLKIAFIWQYSQPYLKDSNGNYLLPSVRQHLQRDYLDMLKVAEVYENIKLNFNIVPTLLDQLQDYQDGNATDYTWFLSKKKVVDLEPHEKEFILTHFFKGENESIILPNARYLELYEKRIQLTEKGYLDEMSTSFSNQELLDLQIWHNLAWIGVESRKHESIQYLLEKQREYSEEDKEILLSFLESLYHSFFERYKDAVDIGKIEIATSPYYNAILPVVMDNHSIRTDKSLPINRFKGIKYAKYQLTAARKRIKKDFDQASAGILFHDTILNDKSLRYVSRLRFDWTVIDESHHVLKSEKAKYFPIDYSEKDKYYVKCFTKSNELIKLFETKFSYVSEHEALKLFKKELYTIKSKIEQSYDSSEEAVITIPLYGDKMWNNYFGHGIQLLHKLYDWLNNSMDFETIRMQDYLEKYPSSGAKVEKLKRDGKTNYNKWIGESATNRAWDAIYKTDEFINHLEENNNVSQNMVDTARTFIHKALGAEWFEWYSNQDSKWDIFYDELFRSFLIQAYEAVLEKPPKSLFFNLKNDASYIFKSIPVTAKISPDIDGYDTGLSEWQGAALYDASKQQIQVGNLSNEYIHVVAIGYNDDNLYFSIRFHKYPPIGSHIVLDFLIPDGVSIYISPLSSVIRLTKLINHELTDVNTKCEFQFNEILEVKIPAKEIGIKRDSIFALQVCMILKESCFERFPQTSVIRTHFMDSNIIKN